MRTKTSGALWGVLIVMALASGCLMPGPYGYYQQPPAQQHAAPMPQYAPPAPIEQPAPTQNTRRVPGRVEFIPLVPITGTEIMIPQDSGKPLSPDPGLRAFTIPAERQVYGEMMRGGGRWQAGYFRAGEVIWARDSGMVGEYRRYTPVRLDRCRNELRGFEIREYAERVETSITQPQIVAQPQPYAVPVPQPYPVPYVEPAYGYGPSISFGIGGGCGGNYGGGYGGGGSYYNNRTTTINRSTSIYRSNHYAPVNTRTINRTVAPQQRPGPGPRPSRVCPPGRPGGR